MTTMTPDYEKAAIAATKTLIQHGICTTPIDPLPILKATPNVFVMTFKEMSEKTNIDRCDVMKTVGHKNQDALTTVFLDGEEKHYIVTYNKMLSSKYVDRALARELGHIILNHDGTKPEEVRNEEARCFAHHLLCPRPLIHAIQKAGTRFTIEMLGNITGCYEHCLSCMQKQPTVHVPVELNRQVRDQFMPYILNLLEFIRYSHLIDESKTATLGNYMEGYEE